MSKSRTKLSSQILEEASSWFIDFSETEVDAAGRESFNAWLRRSPEHVRAYLQIAAFWEDAGALNKSANLDIEGLVARARTEHNVHPLDPAAGPAERKVPVPKAQAGTRTLVQKHFRSFGLAATIVLLLLGSLSTGYLTQRNSYTTEIGEQRSITLEDGSSVKLNSRSRLKVHYTADKRSVDLLEGQALFSVAKDAARPFIVRSRQTSIRAVGTQFDVYRKRTDTVVTVIEGRVAVVDPAHSASNIATPIPSYSRNGELLLTAGQQLTVTPRSAPVRKITDIATATAWTENKLVFESTPLREVVEEFNRYNHQQLVIRDSELYDFHVSGVFPSTNSSRMVEFLRQRFGVTMSRSGDEIEIARRAGSTKATPTP